MHSWSPPWLELPSCGGGESQAGAPQTRLCGRRPRPAPGAQRGPPERRAGERELRVGCQPEQPPRHPGAVGYRVSRGSHRGGGVYYLHPWPFVQELPASRASCQRTNSEKEPVIIPSWLGGRGCWFCCIALLKPPPPPPPPPHHFFFFFFFFFLASGSRWMLQGEGTGSVCQENWAQKRYLQKGDIYNVEEVAGQRRPAADRTLCACF